MLGFLLALMITIICHELGHMLMALLCGVKVEAFSVGFGKPIWKKKYKGIEFRFSPIILGGYCQMAGEKCKRPDGFLAQRYSRKLLILIAGVTINFLLAFICYWLHYGDISFGVMIDWLYIKSIFTKDYTILYRILAGAVPNMFLLQFGLINFFCGVTNLFPIPALDGGWVWVTLLEKLLGKNFVKVANIINAIGFMFLWYIQIMILLYLWIL